MRIGTVVRPVITIAGLDAHRTYRVAHVEAPTPLASVHYLVDLTAEGTTLLPVVNAALVLEVVRPTRTTKPSAAALH